MKIYFGSDIHLEFARFINRIINDPEGILILAGDIIPAIYLDKKATNYAAIEMKQRFTEFLNSVRDFKQIYVIMGNHEHYANGDINLSKGLLEQFAFDLGITNFKVLEDDFVELEDDWVLVGSTLWTDFKDGNHLSKMAAKDIMADYKYCYNGPNLLTPDYTEQLHRNSKEYLAHMLDGHKDKKAIVATHHCPTMKNIDPQYRNDVLSDAFASNMANFILDRENIRYWICAHTHFNISYEVGKTSVITNQRCYPGEDGFQDFDIQELWI